MNAFMDNIKFVYLLNSKPNLCNIYQGDAKSIPVTVINKQDQEKNLKANESINKMAQSFQELNFQYLKERQLINYINALSGDKKEKNSIGPKGIMDKNSGIYSFSEVQKFKTELCHSWELTGTCKYGLNVRQNFNFIFSVFSLMESMT